MSREDIIRILKVFEKNLLVNSSYGLDNAVKDVFPELDKEEVDEKVKLTLNKLNELQKILIREDKKEGTYLDEIIKYLEKTTNLGVADSTKIEYGDNSTIPDKEIASFNSDMNKQFFQDSPNDKFNNYVMGDNSAPVVDNSEDIIGANQELEFGQAPNPERDYEAQIMKDFGEGPDDPEGPMFGGF